jgi:hypothetical protein
MCANTKQEQVARTCEQDDSSRHKRWRYRGQTGDDQLVLKDCTPWINNKYLTRERNKERYLQANTTPSFVLWAVQYPAIRAACLHLSCELLKQLASNLFVYFIPKDALSSSGCTASLHDNDVQRMCKKVVVA